MESGSPGSVRVRLAVPQPPHGAHQHRRAAKRRVIGVAGHRGTSNGPLPVGAATFTRGVGSVALVVWALDELLRGVNPFRRALGAVVLAAQLAGWWSGR